MMVDVERLGPRAAAWADADRDRIFGHILALEMALRTAVAMLRSSAYAKHMEDLFVMWEGHLEDVPDR
jgi:hypothetical protein